jgi:hypothetical protein
VREQRDCPQEVFRGPTKNQPVEVFPGFAAADPNDIVFADIKMLVAKADKLLGEARANQILPDALLLTLAARAVGRK